MQTELARATKRKLRQQHPRAIVLCIFVRGDNTLPGLYVLEDFLEALSDQLGAQSLSIQRQIRFTRSNGQPIRERISFLENYIREQLKSIGDTNRHIFLIIDGYDRMDESLHIITERTLQEYHQYGLRTMVTRRVPAYKSAKNAVCDDCPDHREEMNTYWVCSYCKSNGEESWQCYDCRDSRRACFRCFRDQFEEDKPFVNVPIDISRSSIERYIWKELEREFKHVEPIIYQQITEYILGRENGNITLVRLYLEHILAQQSLLDFDPHKMFDRLPGNVIEFLDAEFNNINAIPGEQGKAARLSITLVSKSAVHPDDFAKALQPHVIPLRNVEDILRLAMGWIVMEANTKEPELRIFTNVASLYINEGYNNSFTTSRKLLEVETIPPFHYENPLGNVSRYHQNQNNFTTKRPTQNLVLLSQLTAAPQSMEKPGSSSTLSTDASSRGTSFTTFSSLSTTSTSATSFTEDDQFPAHQTGISDTCCILDDVKTKSPPRMDTGEQMDSPLSQLVTSGASSQEFPFYVTPPSYRVCKFCVDNVLASEELFGAYAGPLQQKMCVLCRALYDLSSDSLPYNWTLRSSAQGDADKRFMTLTFRSIGSDARSTRSKRFHMFGKRMPTIEMFPSGSSTAPEFTGARIKSWLRECDESHPQCKKYSFPSFAPKRLLDLQSPEPHVYKIVETDMTIKEPYCTLSHSWGKARFITTTQVNLQQHMEVGVPRKDLPKNFAEAIDVVRELGVRYIWIDSLCIVQGEGGDFLTQGGLMHAVYRNSYCNIVAADSKAARDGLFRPRPHEDMASASYVVRQPHFLLGNTGDNWKIVPDDFWYSNLLQSHIYGRGWVFQERLLSPRLLHFARDQIYWDCAAISACESLPSGLPAPLDITASKERHWRGRLALNKTAHGMSGSFDNESPYTFWLAAVESYTSCDLTSKTDKGVAIWSVAKILRDDVFDPSEDYAVGMWSKNFVEQLAWRSANAGENDRLVELQVKYPSWSWFSVHGKIIPHERHFRDRKYWVTGCDTKELTFHVGENCDRDQEPELARESLGVLAHVHPVSIGTSDLDGLNYEATIAVGGQDTKLNAFLDDHALPSQLLAICEFMPLATSESKTEKDIASALFGDDESIPSIEELEDETTSQLTSREDDVENEASDSGDEQEYQSDEEEETYSADGTEESSEDAFEPDPDQYCRAYSGTGLLIVRSDRWLSVQQDEVADLRKRCQTLQNQCALAEQVDVLGKTCCEQQDTGLENHYRRVGMVSFQNMSEEIFKSITSSEPSKIWLD